MREGESRWTIGREWLNPDWREKNANKVKDLSRASGIHINDNICWINTWETCPPDLKLLRATFITIQVICLSSASPSALRPADEADGATILTKSNFKHQITRYSTYKASCEYARRRHNNSISIALRGSRPFSASADLQRLTRRLAESSTSTNSAPRVSLRRTALAAPKRRPPPFCL